MGCNVHDIQNKVVVYDIRNKKLKKLAYFGMIQNYDKFSRWNVKFNKIYTFKNFHIYWKMINTRHVIYWSNYIYFE